MIDRLQVISGNTVVIDPLTDGASFNDNGTYSIRTITNPADVSPLEVHFLEDDIPVFVQHLPPYDMCGGQASGPSPCPTRQVSRTNLANGSHDLTVEITNGSGSVIYSSVHIQFDVL